jgi:hypothetical protein
MKKRTVATVLWALAGWYVGAIFGWLLNLGLIVSIMLALVAGWFVATDPLRVFWTTRSK